MEKESGFSDKARVKMEGKTTLKEIKDKYPSENTILANIAEVNPIVIQNMLAGEPVARWQAEEVLKVLSQITEEDYSLDTVDVVLAET